MIGTSGGLGILIPPSIVMIIYAVITNPGVGQPFIAGIVAGVLMAAWLMLVTWLVAEKYNYPNLSQASLREIWQAICDSIRSLRIESS